VFLFPAGLYYCFSKLTDHNNFIILYGVFSVYFAGVMACLILVLAPNMCIPRRHCRLKCFVNLHEIPGLRLCYRLIQGSAQGCQGKKDEPQVSEGFAGFYRSGASSLQPVEQYFRFLKVLQEFLGSEPTKKGNDSKKPERMGKLETKRNLERKWNLDDFYLQLT
jgi:hypothetical protein